MGTTKTRQCECGAAVASGMERHKRSARHGEAMAVLNAQRDRDQLQQAVAAYQARQVRDEHPDGYFDGAGRWYPDDDEHQACCRLIRRPTRTYPYSLLLHCRSAEHVAEVHDVSVTELRRALRAVAAAKRLELVQVA